MTEVAEGAGHDPRFPERRDPPPRLDSGLISSVPTGAQSEGANFDVFATPPDEVTAR